MLLSSPEFVENSNYGFAVARIRALENNLIDSTGYNQLITVPEERFLSLLEELAGAGIKENDSVSEILDKIEWRFTNTLFLVKDLIVEDEYKRLISLKYDYDLLKIIIKEKKGWSVSNYKHTSMRSSFTYTVLKSLVDAGRFFELGESIQSVVESAEEIKDPTGNQIDIICDRAYFKEIFKILESSPNPFIEGYFRRKIDILNLLTTLRLKIQGKKRSSVKEDYIPDGSIDIYHFEDGYDLNIDGLIQKLSFAWFSSALESIPKGVGEEKVIAFIEKELEEYLVKYIKESMYVTFGVEPVISYLWKVEQETINLRIIILSRYSGIEPAEIKINVRGLNE